MKPLTPELTMTYDPHAEMESREMRVEAQNNSKANPTTSLAHGNLMAELQRNALNIRRHSATRSAASSDAKTHHKYVASMLAPSTEIGLTHEEFATRRYGDEGALMLQTLRKLGPDMHELITDPALMSKTHLNRFALFTEQMVQERSAAKLTPLSPWDIRKQYEKSLGTQDWYRGLKLDDTTGQQIKSDGIKPRVTRALDSLRVSQEVTGNDRGVFKQILQPQKGDKLPLLDEAFDKPFANVIEHRVNKPARGADRVYSDRDFSRNDEKFKQSLPKWEDASSSDGSKKVGSRQAYFTKKWNEYDSQHRTLKTAHMKRLEDESVTQSITRIPEVGVGFGGSELFGGGVPKHGQSVFNYRMQLSPLEVIHPQDWVPTQRMSSGVVVNGEKIPNSPELESIVIGQIPAERITEVTTYNAQQIPTFSALE